MLIFPRQHWSPALRPHFLSKGPPSHEHSAEEGLLECVQYITHNLLLICFPNREKRRQNPFSLVFLFSFTASLGFMAAAGENLSRFTVTQENWELWSGEAKTPGLASRRGLEDGWVQPLGQGNPAEISDMEHLSGLRESVFLDMKQNLSRQETYPSLRWFRGTW